MCGDHYLHGTKRRVMKGSPPHVRGPRPLISLRLCGCGITPACAGTTTTRVYCYDKEWDHPRMCGDHRLVDFCERLLWGSPPHVRGPRLLRISFIPPCGITPACAGTTGNLTHDTPLSRDHPRMCGDHYLGIVVLPCLGGSPPHVRGPLRKYFSFLRSMGITPACAGTTSPRTSDVALLRDHPRMCGDHAIIVFTLMILSGSPPHVRGPQLLQSIYRFH